MLIAKEIEAARRLVRRQLLGVVILALGILCSLVAASFGASRSVIGPLVVVFLVGVLVLLVYSLLGSVRIRRQQDKDR